MDETNVIQRFEWFHFLTKYGLQDRSISKLSVTKNFYIENKNLVDRWETRQEMVKLIGVTRIVNFKYM